LLFAGDLTDLSEMFNNAKIMVERNNHGHAVIATIRERDKDHLLMRGIDGKPGWLETGKSKAFLYSEGARLFKEGVPTIHTSSTFLQLATIEGATLKAPDEMFDDQAVSFVLGIVAGTAVPATSYGMSYAHTKSSAIKRTATSKNRPAFDPRRRRHSVGDIN